MQKLSLFTNPFLTKSNSFAQKISLFSLLLLITYPAHAEITDSSPENTSGMNQVTNVNQLSDVRPTDWAFQALQSLVERYGCIAGYPDATFRGNRTLTRYEFAAGLNACLERINDLNTAAVADLATKEDLAIIQKLQEEFTAELATLRGRVDTLEAHTAELEANQFSTTTQIQGQVIIAANAGGFSGDRIIDATGIVRTQQPNATVLYRAGFDLNTSFSGSDLLKVRLETGSGPSENGRPVGGRDNVGGVLEPFFGSALEYSINPPTNNTVDISRLYYSFRPIQDLQVTLAPIFQPADIIDFNSYAKLSFRDFSTQAFINNYVLFPLTIPSAGVALEWKPGGGAISLRAVYAAAEASNPGNQQIASGVSPFIEVLYPNNFIPPIPGVGNTPNINGGLFGDNYQGTVELEYAPSRNFALRLQYAGGEIFNNHFDAIAANVELTLAEQFGIFGRYGYSSYNNTAFGDINPNYWMAGIAARDLFTRSSLAGFAVGQPFIASEIGNVTQTNYELFYNYPFSQNIQITPTIQLIKNAANQSSNGTIYSFSLRSVFSF